MCVNVLTVGRVNKGKLVSNYTLQSSPIFKREFPLSLRYHVCIYMEPFLWDDVHICFKLYVNSHCFVNMSPFCFFVYKLDSWMTPFVHHCGMVIRSWDLFDG